MAKMETTITVVGKDKKIKGTFELTAGSIYYYRPKAKTATKEYTYQQLISLIENHIEKIK